MSASVVRPQDRGRDPSLLDPLWAFERLQAPADAAGWLTEGSLFALADGVLGVRGGVEELEPSGGGAFLSRVYDRTLIAYHERFRGFTPASDTRLPVADGLCIELRLGEDVMAHGRILDFSRRLDLRTGELVRRTLWLAPGGATVEVAARRVVFGGGVMALRLEVVSEDYAGPVSLTSWLRPGAAGAAQSDDPRLGVGHGAQLDTTMLGAHHADVWLVQIGRSAGVGGAVAQAHRCEALALADAGAGAHGDAAAAVFRGELSPGSRVRLEKAVAYAPFQVDPEGAGAAAALAQARRRAAEHADAGYDACARRAADALAIFWETADAETPGDADLTRALRFNLMHLHRSAPCDGRSGLAAKGLTGEGYEGHVFWDAEAFATPVLALTAPHLARSQLAFRVSTLAPARAHARDLNHRRGALYPWRTIAGGEGSSYFPSGSAQHHINAAIAHAVRLYDQATGDDAFVLGEAAPMVFETARIWMEVGFHDPRAAGAFRICAVTGPDEYSALVDDDHYTNRMAQSHLRYALELADRAPEAACAPDAAERARWAAAAAAMHLPIDPLLGVHPQDAGFLGKPHWRFDPSRRDRPMLLHYHPLTLYRHQVLKQASVVLAHALTEGGARAQRRRDFGYYEPLTAHDSTLSASSHAIVAADIGETAQAARFLRESVQVDLNDLHANAAHGLHMASMAGGWQALVWGFAGLRIEGGRPAFLPRTAPDLPAYAVSMTWRGARLRVEVDAQTTRYRLAPDGGGLLLTHDGLPLSLAPGQVATRPTPRFGAPAAGPVRALVFDLDGVLTDTARAHYLAWKAMADELGVSFDEAANEALKGVDRMGSLALILARGAREYDEAERAALAEAKNARYLRLIADATQDDLLPGARDALERARAAGLPMALASASRNAPGLIQRLGIARFFDAVVDPATIARGKPDPAIFLAAATELGVAPSACMGVEDSRAGVEAIKAAGMSALGVGDPAVLDRADAVVPDLSGVDWSRPPGVQAAR